MSDPCPLAYADFKFLLPHSKITLFAQWITRKGYEERHSSWANASYVCVYGEWRRHVVKYTVHDGDNHCIRMDRDGLPFGLTRMNFVLDPGLHWSITTQHKIERCGICRDSFYKEVSYWCPTCHSARHRATSSGICWLNCVRGALCRDVVGYIIKMLCCVVVHATP